MRKCIESPLLNAAHDARTIRAHYGEHYEREDSPRGTSHTVVRTKILPARIGEDSRRVRDQCQGENELKEKMRSCRWHMMCPVELGSDVSAFQWRQRKLTIYWPRILRAKASRRNCLHGSTEREGGCRMVSRRRTPKANCLSRKRPKR